MATTGKAGKKGGSKMIWIIGGVLLVAGGVGLYYYMKKSKKDGTDKTGDSQNKVTENKNTSTTNTTTTTTDSPSTSGSTTTTIDSPSTSVSTATSTSGSTATSTSNVGSFSLNTTARIKAFQDWLDVNKPFWVLDNGKYKNLRKGTTSEPNRHISGRGYGSNGTNTQRAWKLFGADYVKTLNSFEGNSAFSNFESSLNLDL
jgi:hypothetical protein